MYADQTGNSQLALQIQHFFRVATITTIFLFRRDRMYTRNLFRHHNYICFHREGGIKFICALLLHIIISTVLHIFLRSPSSILLLSY